MLAERSMVEAVGIAQAAKRPEPETAAAARLKGELVEAVGIEPTSEKRVPRASTCVAFVSGHRPGGMAEGRHRRRQLRFDDPDPVRSQPCRSVHFSVASHPAVDRAVVGDVAVN